MLEEENKGVLGGAGVCVRRRAIFTEGKGIVKCSLGLEWSVGKANRDV